MNSLRSKAAYLILAAGLVGAVALGQHNSKRAVCQATNQATHKVAVVVDTLAADTTYPKDAGEPLRTQIDKANKQRAVVRHLVDHLLAPEGC